MNVVRLKLTCQECTNVGYIELTKKDLKNLLQLLKMPPSSTYGDWSSLFLK